MFVKTVDGGPHVAQTPIAVVTAALPTWAEWLFGWSQIIGAVAATIAIGFAIVTLRESNRLRRRGIRETELDRAERQLEALGNLAVLIHGLDNDIQNHRFL